MTIAEICKIIKGQLLQGDAQQRVSRFATDSRTFKKGEVFIAIVGEKFDGHHFVNKATQLGAKALIVSKKVKVKSDIPIVKVDDTVKAFGLIASAHRAKFDIDVIAITGSAGKTTTKEMIAAILGTKKKVLKNYKTHNNFMGVPQTLLKLNRSHQVLVIECGTNQPGDIAWLSQLVKPTMCVFTNVGDAHLEKLKNRSGVFREKIKLLKHCAKDGVVIFNGDDFHLNKIRGMKLSQRKVSFGLSKKNHYFPSCINFEHGKIAFVVNNKKYVIKSIYKHNIYTAIAGICCGSHFGIGYNNTNNSIKKFKTADGRAQYCKFNTIQVLNDTYNANPLSFASAIESLESMDAHGRKIIVCADMMELGKNSKQLHRLIGKQIAQTSTQCVLSFGAKAQWITKHVKSTNSDIETRHFQSIADLNRFLKKYLLPQDVVLVKGSRSMRMERVVEYLNKHFKK